MNASLSRKQILADPLAAYRASVTTEDTTIVAELSRLQTDYTALLSQQKQLQKLSKQISRKIGAAKKLKQPLDALKAEMQQHSGRLKEIDSQLAAMRQQILEKFPGKEPAQQSTASTEEVRTRQRDYLTDAPADFSIRLQENAFDPAPWNRYVSCNPAASTYHRAEWLELIVKTFGHACYYFSAHSDSGDIVGVLPLVRLKSRLFGDFLISLPYVNYGGVVADSADIEAALISAGNSLAERLGVGHVEYRDDIPRSGMPVRRDKVAMVLALPASVDALWSRFPAKLRSQIRRAQREEPTVEIGGRECVDDFYRVFSRNMRDLGTPVYAKTLFANVVRTFPRESRIVIVKLRGRAVAAGFLIAHGKRLEIPWASTIRDYNHLSVNMILYWEVLKYAIEKGFECFDFGRSSKDAPTYRFKAQWGAEPEQLYWHYHLRKEQTIPSITPSNAKYALMIGVWKKLPIVVSQWLGPMIVRNIP